MMAMSRSLLIYTRFFVELVETMAMPQRDGTIEAIKKLDALLEYAVMHGDEEEAERIRAELRKLTDEV